MWARRYRWVSYIGATADDVRDIMVEGESGILAICPKHERPTYYPSKRRLVFPNGCRVTLFTADEPERLRGKQHQAAWADEPASWRYPESWDQLMFGLRLPPDPRVVVTGTPKPVRIIRELLTDPTATVVTGSSYDNRGNVDPAWFADLVSRYEGTRIGRQELLAQLLDDVPGALWTHSTIPPDGQPPDWGDLAQVVLALDPAVASAEDSAEMGIILAARNWDGAGHVLGDYSLRGTPNEVCARVAQLCESYPIDVVVAEGNNGGDWIKSMLDTALRGVVPVEVVHASRGKRTRAEPTAAQYEQGKWRHTPIQQPTMGYRGPVGPLDTLCDQMRTWVPDSGQPSPDRMDALVWASTRLKVSGVPTVRPTRGAADADREAKRPRTAGLRNRSW